MLLKMGVIIAFLNPEIRTALATIDKVFETVGEEAILTAGADGNHKVNSLHYHNDAVDLRLPYKDDIEKVTQRLKDALGAKFYVLLEADHIHVQFGLPPKA